MTINNILEEATLHVYKAISVNEAFFSFIAIQKMIHHALDGKDVQLKEVL